MAYLYYAVIFSYLKNEPFKKWKYDPIIKNQNMIPELPYGPWRNPKIRDPKRSGLLCKEWSHNYLLFFGYKSFVTYMFANIVSQYMAYPLILLNSVFWWKKKVSFHEIYFYFFLIYCFQWTKKYLSITMPERKWKI